MAEQWKHTDGPSLRARRMELGFTLEDLAKMVGVSLRTVRRWETGSSKMHKVSLERLEKVLNGADAKGREKTFVSRDLLLILSDTSLEQISVSGMLRLQRIWSESNEELTASVAEAILRLDDMGCDDS